MKTKGLLLTATFLALNAVCFGEPAATLDENPEEKILADVLAGTKSGVGIPDHIGNVSLGKPEPKAWAGHQDFLGIPGNFAEVTTSGENVSAIAYHFFVYTLDLEPLLIEIFSKSIGSEPKQGKGRQTIWRDKSRRLRFLSRDGGGNSQSYSIVIEPDKPEIAGGKKDGIEAFWSALQTGLKQDSPKRALRLFAFPFTDHSEGQNPDGPLACKSEKEFEEKFPQIRRILLEGEPEFILDEHGGYVFDFRRHLLVVQKAGKEWKAVGFGYRE